MIFYFPLGQIRTTILKRILALPIALVLVSTGTFAQQGYEEDAHPFLTNKFMLNVGMFFPDKDLEISAGADVDLPEPDPQRQASGAAKFSESENVGALQFRWNFESRWWLDLEYFNTDTDVGIRLDEDLTWQDITFKEGSFVEAGTELKVYRLVFGREILLKPDQELGAGIGIHWLDIKGFIQGEIPAIQGDAIFSRGDAKVSAPLPNINIWYMKSLFPRWAFVSRLDWLSASYDKYSGDFWNVSAGVNFTLTRNLGITARYQYFEIDVSVDDSSWNGNIEVVFNGPLISLSATW